jgi:hypothetical protein
VWCGALMCAAAVSAVLVFSRSAEEGKADSGLSGATSMRPSTHPASVPAEPSRVGDDRAIPETTQVSNASDKSGGKAVHTAFERSRDYRALYEQLVQQGADGGGFYAVRLLVYCSSIRGAGATLASPADSREQDRARQLLLERCGSFSEDELKNTLGTVHDPRLKADPINRLETEFIESSDDLSARVTAIQASLDSQDPLLIAEMAYRLFRTPPGVAPVFAGKTFDQPGAESVLLLAWEAASCAAGAACGTEDPSVVKSCGLFGRCFDSRRSLLRDETERTVGADAATLFDSVYPQMEQVIRSRDASAFSSSLRR